MLEENLCTLTLQEIQATDFATNDLTNNESTIMVHADKAIDRIGPTLPPKELIVDKNNNNETNKIPGMELS